MVDSVSHGPQICAQVEKAWQGLSMDPHSSDMAMALMDCWQKLTDVLSRNGGTEKLLDGRPDETQTEMEIRRRINKQVGKYLVENLCPPALLGYASGQWRISSDLRESATNTLKMVFNKTLGPEYKDLYKAHSDELKRRGSGKKPNQTSAGKKHSQQPKRSPRQRKGKKHPRSEPKGKAEPKERTPEDRAEYLKRALRLCEERGTKCDHCRGSHWVSICPIATDAEKAEYNRKRKEQRKYVVSSSSLMARSNVVLDIGKRNALRRSSWGRKLGGQHPNDKADVPVSPTRVYALSNNKKNPKIIEIEFIVHIR
jgi:hypothetical protein